MTRGRLPDESQVLIKNGAAELRREIEAADSGKHEDSPPSIEIGSAPDYRCSGCRFDWKLAQATSQH